MTPDGQLPFFVGFLCKEIIEIIFTIMHALVWCNFSKVFEVR